MNDIGVSIGQILWMIPQNDWLTPQPVGLAAGLPVVPEVKMKRKLDMSLAGVISMGGWASPDAFSTLSSNVCKPSKDEVLSVTQRSIPLSFKLESTSSREQTKSEDRRHVFFFLSKQNKTNIHSNVSLFNNIKALYRRQEQAEKCGAEISLQMQYM